MENKKSFNLKNEIILAKANNEEATNNLVNYYLRRIIGTIYNVLETYPIIKAVPEDYLGVYWKAMIKTIKKYEINKGSFYSLLQTIFVRMLKEQINLDLEQNYTLLNAISLDEYIFVDDLKLCDVIPNEEETIKPQDVDISIASDYLEKSNQNIQSKKEQFVQLQKRIILYKYYGYTLKEIAEMLNTSISSVRRILNADGSDTPLSKIKLIFNKDD